MLQPFRDRFNREFTTERYASLKQELARSTGMEIPFRVCETPCFFSQEMLEELSSLGAKLTHQLIDNPEYMRASSAAVPEPFRVPNEDSHPHFMTVDFGLVQSEDGRYLPKLVELQAFPSIFGFQELVSREYVRAYGLDERLNSLLSGLDTESYWDLLRRVIVGEHDPEQVILTDVRPEQQKTLPDFRRYEEKLGIVTVDIAKLKRQGGRLFYEKEGRLLPVRRIFNRAIADEIVREGIALPFDFRDDLNVEWAGHPNWYFRISKFSLPYLEDVCVPRAQFLDTWMSTRGAALPQEREKLLLKPLYSFAGKGIEFGPSDARLREIPEEERHLYLMQERVRFAAPIRTPEGATQAEIRVMYLWPSGGELTPVICLVRLGRGLMMGVDHNRNQGWVGGSAALHLRR